MQLEAISGSNRALIAQLMGRRRRVQKHKRTQDPHAADVIISEGRCRSPTDGDQERAWQPPQVGLQRDLPHSVATKGTLLLPIVGKWMMEEVARCQPNGLAAVHNGADDVGGHEGIADGLAHAGLWDGVFDGKAWWPERRSWS